MSLKLKNTETYLINYVKKLIVLTRQEIKKPRTRSYNSKLLGRRNITKPLNSSGDLMNSLRLVKKLKNVVNEKGIRATQSYRVVGNSYGEILDEGADGNKIKATQQGIEKWINSKPVTLEKVKNKSLAATLIKRKIDRYGVQGTGFLQQVVNKQFDSILGVTPNVIKDIQLNLEDILVMLGWDKSGDKFTRKI